MVGVVGGVAVNVAGVPSWHRRGNRCAFACEGGGGCLDGVGMEGDNVGAKLGQVVVAEVVLRCPHRGEGHGLGNRI